MQAESYPEGRSLPIRSCDASLPSSWPPMAPGRGCHGASVVGTNCGGSGRRCSRAGRPRPRCAGEQAAEAIGLLGGRQWAVVASSVLLVMKWSHGIYIKAHPMRWIIRQSEPSGISRHVIICQDPLGLAPSETMTPTPIVTRYLCGSSANTSMCITRLDSDVILNGRSDHSHTCTSPRTRTRHHPNPPLVRLTARSTYDRSVL